MSKKEKGNKNNGLGGEIVVIEAMVEAGVFALIKSIDEQQGFGHIYMMKEIIVKKIISAALMH